MVQALQDRFNGTIGQAVIDCGGQIEDDQGNAEYQKAGQVPAGTFLYPADGQNYQSCDAQTDANAMRDTVG